MEILRIPAGLCCCSLRAFPSELSSQFGKPPPQAVAVEVWLEDLGVIWFWFTKIQ